MFYTVKELAEMLKIQELTLRRWCKDKKITHYRINREIRFSKEDIEEYLNKSKVLAEDKKKDKKKEVIEIPKYWSL